MKIIIALLMIFLQCTAIQEYLKSDVKTIDSRFLKEQTDEEKKELSKLTKQLIEAKNEMKKAELGIGITNQKIKISKEFIILYEIMNAKEKVGLEKLYTNYLQTTLSDDEAILKLKQAELAKVKADKDLLEAKIAKRNQAENIQVEEYEANFNSKIKELAEAQQKQVGTDAQKKISEEKLKSSGYKGWK
ncbi:MAG: hypothetical protein H7A23_14280 [Leptospiraceae bacterium]|nr:hypothetical protein [Leptospiraceae bacterium]MCP5495718.1 hypothetical protein [Leptospiraceae bacterium]